MNLLPVCFGPRNGRLNFGDDLGYDPDKRTVLRSMQLAWIRGKVHLT